MKEEKNEEGREGGQKEERNKGGTG